CAPCVASPSPSLAAPGDGPSVRPWPAAGGACHRAPAEANSRDGAAGCTLPRMAGDPEGVRSYHQQTKHSPARLHSDPPVLDWAIMPRPFKVYPALEPLPLPRDVAASARPALAALLDAGPASDGPLDRAALARLLYFSAGVLRRRAYPGGEIFFRAAACTGALYPIDPYVVCAPLPDPQA